VVNTSQYVHTKSLYRVVNTLQYVLMEHICRMVITFPLGPLHGSPCFSCGTSIEPVRYQFTVEEMLAGTLR